MRVLQVRITRSERESAQIEVGAWEAEVIRYIYGDNNVEVVGKSTDKREYPDPATELDRLHRRYGARNDEGGTPANNAVAAVYGPMGLERLSEIIEREQQIEEGTYEEPEAKPVRVAKPAPVRAAKKAAGKPQVSEIDE